MKKKLFSMLVLLAAVVTGAWAQGSDPDPIELTSTDGETWTLASMPDYDVELEVEYYDEVATNVDPENPGVYYYSTFYHSTQKYALTNDGTQAFVADLSGSDLLLTKIAEGTDIIPANTAVIFRKTGSDEPVVLDPTNAEPVSVTATNSLLGTDVAVATPDNCYVLSGHSSDNSVTGVGFYRYEGTNLNPHKAYVIFSGSFAPQRMRFIFEEEQNTTAVDNAEAENTQTIKVIENGALYIIKDGVRYNAQGQIVEL